ncbi:DNA-binding transcriptional regulator, MerR family [Evansella caseinilytica]|uniref:DNA-binding transcriptional regulator, MerR family n=1 Tax=Evansella caseinilytica TaxID=1503961 RepID=A0A1H3HYK6_9BACI|nr:MerR family transcriptional regulator [Evansella caseinilytica]SDY20472.1 DNA-binding transcriptional regulator, MerR family [Evansella caseinilytica]
MKTFTTGEFAKIFGIKKDTLFYYDKIGLFKPAGIRDNRYRYYTTQQLDVFSVIYSLRELKFPIKLLEDYLETPSPRALIELSKKQLSKIAEEIEKLEQIHSILHKVIEQSEEALNAHLDEIVFKSLEKEYVLLSDKNPSESDTSIEEWCNFHDHFLSKIKAKGPLYIGSVIDKNDLMSGRFGRVERLFVRTNQETDTVKQAGIYAISYYKGSYERIGDFYKGFIRKLNETGYTVCGDAYEEYLLNGLSTPNSEDYVTKISVKVNMPCVVQTAENDPRLNES